MEYNTEIKKLPDGRIAVYTTKIKDKTMDEFFNIGDTLYGFCNGYFGRDDYETKICVFVTDRYAVFQYLDGISEGNATVLNGPSRLDAETVSEWKRKNKDQ